MERFGPKENVMSGEKNETYIINWFPVLYKRSIELYGEGTSQCYIDDFGYSMFGLGYGWRHVIMYAG